MVLGFFEGSMEIFAFRKTCPPEVTVISSPLQTRFICLRISSGMGRPSAVPDTIDHSPCNRSMSFLMPALSSAATSEIAAQASPIRNTFCVVLGTEQRKQDIHFINESDFNNPFCKARTDSTWD